MTSESQNYAASEHLHSFSSAIKGGLSIGKQYVQLIDQLVDTNDLEELLAAAQQLAVFKLGTKFVQFPHQYRSQDYYMLFMARLLELHQDQSLKLNLNKSNWTLSGGFSSIDTLTNFEFILERSDNGGAFFTETNSKESLFYLNLERRMIRFNNRALVNLFVVKLAQDADSSAIEQAVGPLISLTHYLKQDLGFSVDFGILDANNAAQYYLAENSLPVNVIDKLFVQTEGTDYMLLNMQDHIGATLIVDADTKLNLFARDAVNQQDNNWLFSVEDSKQAVSFFDMLVRYPLIRKWYLENRDVLEVKSDPLVFAG
ncbi:hypothetical protein LOOC260_109410 [Paucilactobacillus hokkaidonensis JCM 18461]|uniref:Uncharacterized protein n=2 Tax=Paucilactobacillus hokkaidonensis TaxID=1193095 RepID=A0A0A1GYE1_9LACO|nr:hypothetical protein [Paucilactobacillus hokkaidonensis]KRO08253.1 hypothetical protein IV59_GL001247 [Paucilactobacillus hokkaidonensis]BAP85481.1 hypothetical protein LOOC260_109410 [Paucilactobacillus hokkaidonensis JCM 18461]